MDEIGLSGLLLDRPFSGTAVYTRNLAQHLPAAMPDVRFRLFTRNAAVDTAEMAETRLPSLVGPLQRESGPVARIDKLLWESVALPVAAGAFREKLVHSLYFAAPLVATAPRVVTVHDLIPLVIPGYHRSRQSRWYSRYMALAVRRAEAIITVSEYSKRDICRVLEVTPDRVTVTVEAADGAFSPDRNSNGAEFRERYGLADRYVLYAGGAERRKNLEVLIRAWKLVAARMAEEECSLVIVANFPPPDDLYPDIPGLVGELGLERQVRLLSHVPQEDMPDLYREAMGFCFPSRYEGFGLTPLEAMACGTPVIVSSATSLPEVVGDAGLVLGPDDPAEWAAAIEQLVGSSELRSELAAAGLARAATFSWQRTAQETAQVYRQVLSR